MFARLLSLILIVLLLVGISAAYSQDESANLRILIERNSFTVAVIASDSVSVIGLQFAYTGSDGQIKTFEFESSFPVLQFTESNVHPGECYVIQLANSSSPLPSLCGDSSKVFKLGVSASDVFWYDSISNRLRDIGIFQNGLTINKVCSAADASGEGCSITYPQGSTTGVVEPVAHNADWSSLSQTFDGVEMVLVPPGCFQMGNDPDAYYWNGNDYIQDVPDGGEQCFDQAFWIDHTEVTNKQFNDLGGLAANSSNWTDDSLPRENINWFEAQNYCKLRGGQLPTEAQWEYVARGPDNLQYAWGNDFTSDNAVYFINSGEQTAEVGNLLEGASWVGALDMSGNTWEWVSSIYQPYPYENSEKFENINDRSSLRSIRGGAWNSLESDLRTANRQRNDPLRVSYDVGFRCARPYNADELAP